MLVKTLKNILPSYDGKQHSDFQKIIKSVPKEYSIKDEAKAETPKEEAKKEEAKK